MNLARVVVSFALDIQTRPSLSALHVRRCGARSLRRGRRRGRPAGNAADPSPPATPRRTPRRLRHPPRRQQTPPSTPDSCASGASSSRSRPCPSASGAWCGSSRRTRTSTRAPVRVRAGWTSRMTSGSTSSRFERRATRLGYESTRLGHERTGREDGRGRTRTTTSRHTPSCTRR